jgi:hypothetical protein
VTQRRKNRTQSALHPKAPRWVRFTFNSTTSTTSLPEYSMGFESAALEASKRALPAEMAMYQK